MRIDVNGLGINYIDEGEGTPVLLLHGWASSNDVYKGFINTLKGRCAGYIDTLTSVIT